MSWRDVLLDAMRVPPTPAPPPGSPPHVFRASPNFYKLRMLSWAVTQILAIFGLVWAIWFVQYIARTGVPSLMVWVLRIAEIFGVIAVAWRLVVGWLLVRLDYELRWYMLSDRAIRIREGITTIREKTIALANIQNISIKQGPLQRLLGIADVEVKTAGGGGESSDAHSKGNVGEPMHVAYFRGVANATEIRDLVSEGVRRQRDAGLGDPDETHAPVADDDVPAAIAELLTQVRALRRSVA
ncbi:MAG TPA: PH domain-containing protein [Thermoanaerobaculia bacterium]|jgi:membrane protein YdbS with pleckstrin-like domain|nr:PH domain-containing protein [Thermoanaerobaculia bacterium]